MNARTRTARHTLRQRTRTNRTTTRATRNTATGLPQPASTHLIAAGIHPTLARRYSGAFSRTVTPTTLGETTIKLRGRRTKTVPVKLYDQATFTARLATYRPRNAGDARLFERAAYRLAA
ncbi:hypothetical protein [Streptomyces diastaticus]